MTILRDSAWSFRRIVVNAPASMERPASASSHVVRSQSLGPAGRRRNASAAVSSDATPAAK